MMFDNLSDVNSLTGKLALMQDSQLPRLAQQYKNDAITLGLIWNEQKRREHIRNAPKITMQHLSIFFLSLKSNQLKELFLTTLQKKL